MKLNTKLNSLAKSLGLTSAIVLCSSASHAAVFPFTQTGYAEGATVSGSFTAEDTDTDGVILFDSLSFAMEVTDFSLSFSGNSFVPAFALGMADLQHLTFFQPGDSILGNDLSLDPFGGGAEGLVASSDDYFYATGQGPLFVDGGLVQDVNLGGTDETVAPLLIPTKDPDPTAVPDSGSAAALLTFALTCLVVARRRLA